MGSSPTTRAFATGAPSGPVLHRSRAWVVLAAVLVLGGSVVSEGEEATRMALEITSPAFAANGTIPKRFTCEAEDLSPPLAWTGAPDGTASFALIMDDPDAPPGTWVHWVLYDIPAGASGLPEGVPESERLDDGAAHGACWRVDRFSRIGYHGPCPPSGSPHRYRFRLYALDTVLGIDPRATKSQVLGAMDGHGLEQAELVGTFGR